LTAGFGVALCDNIASIAESVIEVRETFARDLNVHNKYKGYVDIYKRIFTALNNICADLSKSW